MINLNPINKKIRETLAKRSAALKRDITDTNPLAPVSDELVNTTSRSVWVKMFSPVIVKNDGVVVEGARIFGGEVFEQGGTFPTLFGYNQTYGRVTGESDSLQPLRKDVTLPLQRPMPGITNFECTYEGGLAAIRQASVNFIVWSLDDLERLTPHFLAHGRGVLLEWGYGSINTSSTETLSDDEMIDGTGYNKINKLVLDSGGLYDGMAAVISNYEYSLRDDGGFDCTVKLVSRGVNVLNEQLDNSDASFKAKSGDDSASSEVEAWPTLDEFTAVMEEELLSVAIPGTEWFTSVETIELSKFTDQSWNRSKQPPGVFVYQDDATLSFEKRAGPYVSWGFLEDNVLSKWVGKFDKDKKVINQFRSIEPMIDPVTGDFLDPSGNTTTDIEKAQFESVRISNHKHLFTPHMDRWILPGQFPGEMEKTEEGKSTWEQVLGIITLPVKLTMDLVDYFHTSGAEFVDAVATTVNTGGYFEHFRTVDDEGKGYLRNILLSTNLIRESFSEAKNLKEGLQNLFDEINKDVDGFWGFQVVVDPYINGNIKVIDTKSTVVTPKDLLEKERPKGNPESALYVFDSWGEESIVKKQELSVQLPSSFAVSAMYAGVAKEGTEDSAGANDEQSFAKLNSADGEDPSQPEVVKPSRIEGNFGSTNPYQLEGAGSIPSPNNKFFGPGKGIGFTGIDYVKLMAIINDRLASKVKGAEQKKSAVEENAKDSVAKVDVSIKNFIDSIPKALYDEDGNLAEDIESNILHKKVMNNILKGNVNIAKNTNLSEKDLRGAQDATDLFPVELSIDIDGIGGIFPGNCFHVNYIQKRFTDFCVFQIFGVSHSVSKDNWTTSITGKLRVATGLVYENLHKPSKVNPKASTKDDDVSKKEQELAKKEEEENNTLENTTTSSNQSSEYDIQFTEKRSNKLEMMGTPNSTWNTVVFAYDKLNPQRERVKGEAVVKFQTGASSASLRAKKKSEMEAMAIAMERYKTKYNLK